MADDTDPILETPDIDRAVHMAGSFTMLCGHFIERGHHPADIAAAIILTFLMGMTRDPKHAPSTEKASKYVRTVLPFLLAAIDAVEGE